MTEQLPDSVAQIAEVIGTEAALQLVRQWPRTKVPYSSGGRCAIYVPSTMPASHPIATIIGHDKAALLSRRFGNEMLFPAKCDAHVLRRAILLALDAGASTDMVSRTLGVTPQHVRRIRRANISAITACRRNGNDSRMNKSANHA